MIDSKARVTIGLPVYNGERFLKETLDSILSQTCEDFEVIISDNASTDRTYELCQDYAAKESRILYYQNKENIGAVKNFNRVFELSTSEYFKWASSDDLIAPEFLEKCIEVLDNEPKVILCYPLITEIDEHGSIIGKRDCGLNLLSEYPVGRFLTCIFNLGSVNPIFGLMRSEVLRKTRLFRPVLDLDMLLLGELSLYGGLKEIPEYLFFRRIHAGSCTSLRDKEKLREWIDIEINQSVILMRLWNHFIDYLISIKRAPISSKAKIFLMGFLLMGVVLNYKPHVKEVKQIIKNMFERNILINKITNTLSRKQGE